MNKKILWFWLLLLQVNFLVTWFKEENNDWAYYSILAGGAVSYGLAALLLYIIFAEKKNGQVKILTGILIFIAAGVSGFFIYSPFNVYLLYASLLLFLLIVLFTSIHVFRKKELEESE